MHLLRFQFCLREALIVSDCDFSFRCFTFVLSFMETNLTGMCQFMS